MFYTCDACQEVVKAVAIDNHLLSCEKCTVLTCVDCVQDFSTTNFKNHKYCNGKELWCNQIYETSVNYKGVACVKEVIDQLCQLDNIPRNKEKLMNFLKLGMFVKDPEIRENVWNAIINKGENCDGEKKTDKNETSQQQNGENNSESPEAKSEKANSLIQKYKNNYLKLKCENGASPQKRKLDSSQPDPDPQNGKIQKKQMKNKKLPQTDLHSNGVQDQDEEQQSDEISSENVVHNNNEQQQSLYDIILTILQGCGNQTSFKKLSKKAMKKFNSQREDKIMKDPFEKKLKKAIKKSAKLTQNGTMISIVE